MKRLNILKYICIQALLLFYFTSLYANEMENKPVTTAAPPPPPTFTKILPPKEYTHCYLTKAAWLKHVWIPAHQECSSQISQNKQRLWIAAYWGCISTGDDHGCEHWKWFPQHEQTL